MVGFRELGVENKILGDRWHQIKRSPVFSALGRALSWEDKSTKPPISLFHITLNICVHSIEKNRGIMKR